MTNWFDQIGDFFSTHPSMDKRMNSIAQVIDEMQKDRINLDKLVATSTSANLENAGIWYIFSILLALYGVLFVGLLLFLYDVNRIMNPKISL